MLGPAFGREHHASCWGVMCRSVAVLVLFAAVMCCGVGRVVVAILHLSVIGGSIFCADGRIKVYEERRQESLKIMDELNNKFDKIQEVISFIEVRGMAWRGVACSNQGVLAPWDEHVLHVHEFLPTQ